MTTETTDLIALADVQPGALVQSREKFNAFYEKVAQEVAGHEPDLSTDKGRKAIASLAYKVTRTKTAIDEAGKKLTEDKKKEIAAVDAERKAIREKLDALAAEVRKPLTDWETEQEARQKNGEEFRARIDKLGRLSLGMTAAEIRQRAESMRELIGQLADALIPEDLSPELAAHADSTMSAMMEAHARQEQHEKDQAELAALRRERAEKEAAEAKRAAEEAAAAAERERQERAAREAEEAAARAEEARKAEEARRIQEAEAEKARKAAEEDARRQADQEHRKTVLSNAKAAIVALDIDEDTARKVVLAIAAGAVPAVTIKF